MWAGQREAGTSLPWSGAARSVPEKKTKTKQNRGMRGSGDENEQRRLRTKIQPEAEVEILIGSENNNIKSLKRQNV